MLLEKQFIIDKDYKNITNKNLVLDKKEIGNGGTNKQTFMLTIKCFKSLCLKARTKKADEIHEYYMKLEEIMHDMLEDETHELKMKLLQKDEIIQQTIESKDTEKHKAVERALISQFPVNIECVYFGTVENTNEQGETLIKFGHTNNLGQRVQDHHKVYQNFTLKEAFKVQNKVAIENLIKTHEKIRKHLRTIEVGGKNKTEMIAYDPTNYTLPRFTKIIKDIIHTNTYSIENFNALIKRNEELEEENSEKKETIKIKDERIEYLALTLNEKNDLIKSLEETIKSFNSDKQNEAEKQVKKEETIAHIATTFTLDKGEVFANSLIMIDETTKKFNQFIDECCILTTNGEVESADITGQFRIWHKERPKRVIFERFNEYLRTRFFATRVTSVKRQQLVHGFKGVALKPIAYKKRFAENKVEDFVFSSCDFAPDNRLSILRLFEINDDVTIDLKAVKAYLDVSPYVVRGVVHLYNDKDTYDGYYGIGLKSDKDNVRANKSKSSKMVFKVDIKTKTILQSWESIVKAALSEGISQGRMTRSIKSGLEFEDGGGSNYFYRGRET